MLVRSVVHNQIHNDLQAALVRFGKQLIHIFHRAEQRVDILIVGDIVAVIVLRGLVDGGEPQHIHAKTCKIVKTTGDALDVANAVAIGILEGTRVNLIDHRIGPPWVRCGAIGTHRVGKDGTIEIGHANKLLCFLYIH